MKTIATIAALLTASPASAQMQTFSDSQGNYAGSSAQIGSNVRNYFNSDDQSVVSSMRSGNITSYYDGRGN